MNPLEETDLPLERKLADVVGRVAVAMRADDWSWFGGHGLNPRQGQILLLLGRRNTALRLSEIAAELAVTQPTVSDSVNSLAGKGLVSKVKAPDDARAVAISLSRQGKTLVKRYQKEGDAIQAAIAGLPEEEKVLVFRSLLKVIRELQIRGRIPTARMCVSCRHFRPNAHADEDRPHHCALVDVAIGDKTLRHDCPEHEAADEHLANTNWKMFAN